jgi:hypothetical protein
MGGSGALSTAWFAGGGSGFRSKNESEEQMKNRITSVVLATVAGLLLWTAQAQTPQVNATGWLTDTLCGAKGANSLHIDCAKRKVASGRAKYAFYDERTRRLYVLADQQAAEQYLGQHLQVTGTISFGRAGSCHRR